MNMNLLIKAKDNSYNVSLSTVFIVPIILQFFPMI